MSLIPKVYSSTDPGAPQLTGQAGALLSVLRAVLVTGYGTAPNAKAAAGWTEAFTGTNKAVFRNSPVEGTGAYLRVDDSATVSGSDGRVALLRVFESMTDVDTGVNPAPTVAQYANGVNWMKSNTADAASKAWVAIANERFIYLFVNMGTTDAGWVGTAYFPAFAGDLVSRKPGDMYCFMLSDVKDSALATYSTGAFTGFLRGPALSSTTAIKGNFLLRPYTGVVGAVPCSCAALSDANVQRVWGSTGSYPDAVGGQLMFERGIVAEGAYLARGFMPNVYAPLHDVPFADLQVVTDVAGLPAGTQLFAKSYSQATTSIIGNLAYRGQLLFDISNAW